MAKFTCQHCRNRKETDRTDLIPVICLYCEKTGHSGFRHECSECNPSPNGSGGGKHNLTFKDVMKKAA